jgi:hypothetical protein
VNKFMNLFRGMMNLMIDVERVCTCFFSDFPHIVQYGFAPPTGDRSNRFFLHVSLIKGVSLSKEILYTISFSRSCSLLLTFLV